MKLCCRRRLAITTDCQLSLWLSASTYCFGIGSEQRAAEWRQAILSSSPRHHHRLSIVDCRCGRLLVHIVLASVHSSEQRSGEKVGEEQEQRSGVKLYFRRRLGITIDYRMSLWPSAEPRERGKSRSESGSASTLTTQRGGHTDSSLQTLHSGRWSSAQIPSPPPPPSTRIVGLHPNR